MAMNIPGYEASMKEFMRTHPYSIHVPQIRYRHALNLFDSQKYKAASVHFAQIAPKQLTKSQRTEFLFKRAYSDLENKLHANVSVRWRLFLSPTILPLPDMP